MNALDSVLAAYRDASGRDAALWEWRVAGERPVLVASASPDGPTTRTRPEIAFEALAAWATAGGFECHSVGSPIARASLLVAPCDRHRQADDSAGTVAEIRTTRAPDAADTLLSAVLPIVRRLMRERDGATVELAERYEEISLLYAIGELLGSGASVESVAFTVLRELAQTVGAPRGALMLYDATREALVPAALLGIPESLMTVVPANDESLLVVRAFRSGESCTAEGGEEARRVAPLLAADGGPVLAVPIRRVAMDGVSALGTVMLAGRPGDASFSAGDRKLVTAIASQVGTALHNARLVRAALEQEQLAREMRLAHDLQLKLLPSPAVVGPEARAAARVVPAESVGGDFYLLARLTADRTGVVIGDVSGHGYQAALVMALAMSAAAIHVQAVVDPGVAIEAVRRSLIDELESTEMSITLFYGVIDEAAGVLRFANAGHPHAFILRADGRCERLGAQVPPLGFGEGGDAGESVPWDAGDRLLLFTDGLADARNAAGARFGEASVLAVAMRKHASADATLEAIFEAVGAFAGDTPLGDDLAVVTVERVGADSDRPDASGAELGRAGAHSA
jgi:phosphoserine phosphatase RsbU/P